AACSSSGQPSPPTNPENGGGSTTATDPGSTGTTGSVVARGEGISCWTAPAATGVEGISFSDQTEALGLTEPFLGMHGHAAVWADFDDDLRPDLYMGTFADRDPENYRFRGASGPSPDRLVLSGSGALQLAGDLPDMFTRTSGGAVADLDGDGDLDLVVSRNYDDDNPDAPGTQVLRNDGGVMVPVDIDALPTGFGGRSVGVLDYDQDGLYDLFIAEDRFSGGSSVLLHNQGDLGFEDATAAAGIPTGVHGLGVAVADLTGNGFADIFVAGSNRLFVADGEAGFRESDSTVFEWPPLGNEDDVAGVSVGDVNRDGTLDLVVGQHFNSTVDDGTRVPVRLFLNRGVDGSGNPQFEDVTEAAGLIGLPTKAPHVEINDFDNDGWPDILTTASAGDGTAPAVFRHEGLEGDVPRFATPEGLGHPQYWVAGPSADVDMDGRLDLFLVEWEPSLPSLLLRNESRSGHWLGVSVGAEQGFGIGWKVEVYRAGGGGDLAQLLGAREITVTQGYSAGVAPIAHFGLGEDTRVDLRLVPPGGVEPVVVDGVDADQHLRVPDGCG
ncbi:MAG TPA: CRTAC1 family protein, partial [Acidimicrobiia bacterium]|nr:CRTAC1 family protein [Acidimicrobiia bacterium]